MRLGNSIALVTGAGSGIGRAISQLFAREGASLLLLDENEQLGLEARDEIVSMGASAEFIRVDLADPVRISAAFALVRERTQRLDIVCNSAGIGKRVNLTGDPLETWDKVINVNLRGTYLVCRNSVPLMSERGGSIVNLASMAGLVAVPGQLAAYTASKGGVIALSRSMALDYAARQIRVNCICPGVIQTPMTREMLADDERREKMIAVTPLGRLGTAMDVAYAALFLASPESSFVTGHALVVDGGWTIQ
ncbi:MAG: SDR family NAD(P)-dependent oxidoreductase [Dehalococcoidia bacterium]|nr:SDR family NAD(P)-dependent oxidoreductase [Dehalococcoidia bacterium]